MFCFKKIVMFYQFFVYISVVSARKDCLLEYTGKTSTTTTGRECQRWDTEYPHIPKYQPKVRFRAQW